MEDLTLLIRLVLAAIFILAGVAKFLDLRGSEKAFVEFGMPSAIALPLSIALSIAEIVIGLMFLSTDTSWYAAVGASALLLLFIGQMTYQMARGNAPDCHCFGQIHSAPVGKLSIFRNVCFAVLALSVVARGQLWQGTALSDPRLNVIQLFFGAALVALLFATIYYLKKISEQQTELIRRVELLEFVGKDGASVERETTHPHEGLPIGAVFPDFELEAATGGRVAKTDGRPTMYFFISPECSPCKALIPDFERWQTGLADRVRVTFISSGKATDNRKIFGNQIATATLLQLGREVRDAVKAKWTPTAVYVDARGRIASHLAAGDEAIRDLVERVLAGDLSNDYTHFANGHGHSHGNKIGVDVPTFSLADAAGKTISPKYFADKPTLVTFWSQACPHCEAMMDELRDWDQTKGQDEPGLLIFSDGEADVLGELGLNSPIIPDKDYKTSVAFGMVGTPSAVLVDEHGKIVSETAVGAAEIWSLIGKRK